MAAERIELDGDPAAAVARIRAAVTDSSAVRDDVAVVIASVRDGGDAALLAHVRRFETGGADPAPLRVGSDELRAALDALDPDVRAGLEVARANVGAVARAGLDVDARATLPEGQTVTLRELPVARAAIYVPGGQAPYPSTVVMGAETARAAGVESVVVCAPGGHPAMLAACALCEVDEVYRMGGAQAIAALAHGTESVPAVDVVVGPGSVWVQEAKRQVFGTVGIDGFAGPSDLVVLAAEDASAELIALDLRAQAEHGAESLVVCVSPSRALLDDVAERIDGGALVHAGDLEQALAFSEAFAPEHLELIGATAEALAPRVRRAGCVFVGALAGTAFGDYVAGSNHTLPTEGAARFASGLSTRHFRRRMAEVRIPPGAAAALAPRGAAIARAEGFDVHAESMEARIGQNPGRA